MPLSDEEFASLAEDGHLVAAAMVIALLGILWWAVHSGRVVAAILPSRRAAKLNVLRAIVTE